MTTTIAKQEIENTVKEVWAKLRPWEKAPRITIIQYSDNKYSITAGYDRIGKVFQTPNMEWGAEAITNYGSTHSVKPTLEEAIAYLIKICFGMR